MYRNFENWHVLRLIKEATSLDADTQEVNKAIQIIHSYAAQGNQLARQFIQNPDPTNLYNQQGNQQGQGQQGQYSQSMNDDDFNKWALDKANEIAKAAGTTFDELKTRFRIQIDDPQGRPTLILTGSDGQPKQFDLMDQNVIQNVVQHIQGGGQAGSSVEESLSRVAKNAGFDPYSTLNGFNAKQKNGFITFFYNRDHFQFRAGDQQGEAQAAQWLKNHSANA